MKLKKTIIVAVAAISLASCNSQKNVVYMQDSIPGQKEAIVNFNEIKIQPRDQISILVTCKEPQLASLFNLVENRKQLGKSGSQGTSSGSTAPYTVDSEGNIDFPVVGEIHVEGLTREQVAAKIKNILVSDNLVTDPVVTVEFTNLHFSVLGEVTRPGSYAISGDHINILEALSQAGDLTIYGKRDKVHVIRETGGQRHKYEIDLRSDSLFNSPAYYLQQNDVVYVEPNNVRAGQSSVNENNWKSVGLWISLASLLMSAAVLIFK